MSFDLDAGSMVLIHRRQVFVFGCEPEALALAKVLDVVFSESHYHAFDPAAIIATHQIADWENTTCVFVVPAGQQEKSYPIRLIRHVRLEIGWPGAVLIVANLAQAELTRRWGFFKLQEGEEFIAQVVLPRPIQMPALVTALSILRPYRPAAWKANLRLLMNCDEICRFCFLLERIENKFKAGSWAADLIAQLTADLMKADSVIRMALGHSGMNALRPYLVSFGASADAIARWGSPFERNAFIADARTAVNERLMGLVNSGW